MLTSIRLFKNMIYFYEFMAIANSAKIDKIVNLIDLFERENCNPLNFDKVTSFPIVNIISWTVLLSINFPMTVFSVKRHHEAKYIPISPGLFLVMQVVSRKLIHGAHSRIYLGFWFLHANHLSCFKEGSPRFKGKWITGSPGTTVPFRSNLG